MVLTLGISQLKPNHKMNESNIDPIRVQPHNIEAEEGLLACCLLDPSVIDLCIESQIEPGNFYRTAHEEIYLGLLAIHEAGQSKEGEIALLGWLRKNGKEEATGGISAILAIQDRVETSFQAQFFAQEVAEKAMLRKIIRESRVAIEDAYEQTVDGVQITSRLAKLVDLAGAASESECKPVAQTLDEAVEQIQRELSGKEEMGICFGLKDLDERMQGLRPATQTVLAARPGMGKTSLVQLATEWCEQNEKTVLIFSFEMTGSQFDYRYICMRARIDCRRIREGIISAQNREDIARVVKETKAAGNRWIVDGEVDVHQMRAIARRMHHKHGLDLVIVDYLQIAGRTKGMKSEEAVSEISAGTKHMTKELNIPSLVLAQINRESEKENRKPRLSDLRESGAIEQNADNVIFLHPAGDIDDPILRVEAIIAKCRYGAIGSCFVQFNKQFTRYELAARQSESEMADNEAEQAPSGPTGSRRDTKGTSREFDPYDAFKAMQSRLPKDS